MEDQNLLVSIVTVCYCSQETIRRTIESVLNQTYSHIEYLIIDGNSSDKTVHIAESYKKLFEQRGISYHIISEKDEGIYDAMNKGIHYATGNLIGIINSDDWYEKEAIQIAVNTYCKEPYDMFYADVRLITPDGRKIIKKSKRDIWPTSRHWNHPTTFITSKTYAELGGYRNEGIHDDFDLVLRIRKANKKIVIRNILLANFCTGGASNNKSLSNCWKRCHDRYVCYRNNDYSRWYLFECIGIELAKYLIG